MLKPFAEMDLLGKNVCFVGFGGIGLESCRHLLLKGIGKLAILDLVENNEAVDDFKAQYPDKDIFFLQVDVSKKSQIEDRIKEVVGRLGHIDVLVNGAGIVDEQDADLTVTVNLIGLINTTLIGLSYMDVTKGGRGGLIVNISSVMGLEPASPIPIYAATKFGIVGFSRSIGNKYVLEGSGVSCIVLCPGFTITNIIKGLSGAFLYSKESLEEFATWQTQTAGQMGECFVKVLEVAKNGSIWICDLGEIREAAPSVFWTPTLKLQQ